jgi:hypothetical protein
VFAHGFGNYKKGALDSQPQVIVYQLLDNGRWFSPDTPASSSTKTGSHDIAEILLKVALKQQKKKNNQSTNRDYSRNFLRQTSLLFYM